ncbi:hypothetical protein GCK32_004450 [Trichostrongylus colubriformis]|uniref:Uncharacterized protein n=1 Tax=Trichostrongylus colubriformis TaxID=6319 RepID=A0AAN8FAX8_TRICO
MQSIIAFCYRILELASSQTMVMLLPAMLLPGFTIYCRKDKPLTPQSSEKSKILDRSSEGAKKISEDSLTLAEDNTQRSGTVGSEDLTQPVENSNAHTQSHRHPPNSTKRSISSLRCETTQTDGADSTQLGTEHGNETDMNVFVLKAAQKQTVVHPRLVTKKGNIDKSLFRSRSQAEIRALEEEMASDHESEKDNSKEAVKNPSAKDPKIKWGDSKCVVYETSEEPTIDEDEMQDEPDIWWILEEYDRACYRIECQQR